MYLKSLEIQGFKSFAEKITLKFHSGITSVVGPNGSGKSNIADAVRWVLGEQSVKTLRGHKMEDVIFAGTQYRRPVGFAQVSLTIDNSDKSLPLEYTEVTVTRRLYRSGESEYMINKTACRLKDITELFLNTGIGKEGYSIIGQGRIDEILSSRSEDRRGIFEEAAGIMKYKVKKKEAERKLGYTRQNLMRICDILNELEMQLEPLAAQAETARKYIKLSNELKGLEVSLYLENIARYRQKLSEIDSLYLDIKKKIEISKHKLEETTILNKKRTEKLNEFKLEAEELKEEITEAEKLSEKYHTQIKLNEEKKRNIEQSNLRFFEDISQTKMRIEDITAEQDKKRLRIKNLKDSCQDFKEKLSKAEDRMLAIMERLDSNEVSIEKMKESVMDKLDELSNAKISLQNTCNENDSIERREAELEKEISHLVLEKDRGNMEKEELDENLGTMHKRLKNIKEKRLETERIKKELLEKLRSDRKEQNTVSAEIQACRSKRKILLEMERNMEGYNKSVKAVLSLCKKSDDFARGICGVLAQLIKVENKFETAIEISLGGALQNIVTVDEFYAKKAIEFLKAGRTGRVTFLPITTIRPRSIDSRIISKIKGMPGFLGIAANLVVCDKKYRSIVENLLGKTIVVENLDYGINIARSLKFGVRIVTLEGEIINAGGAMTGGAVPAKSTSLLGRQRLMAELEEKLLSLEEKYEKIETSSKEISSRIRANELELEKSNAEFNKIEIEALKIQNNIRHINEKLDKIRAKSEVLRLEKNELKENKNRLKEDIQHYEIVIEKIEKEIQNLKKMIKEHQLKSKEGQNERDALHIDINDYKVSINSIKESINTMIESIEQLENEKKLLSENIEKRLEEQDKNKIKIEELELKNKELKDKIQVLAEKKTGMSLKLDSILEQIGILEEEFSNGLDDIAKLNKEIYSLQEEFNRIDVKKAKLESELESAKNRLWDEYELTFNNAMEIKQEISNIKKAQVRINELKTQIRDLGTVNVSAIEDYVKTKERYTFMNTQKEDLVKSEEKLQKIIREMTVRMKKQFIEQFYLINKNFNEVFRELFEGGRAELQLSDKDNVLESGIEIIVQPPGKKLQNMMLLSGGERALTAIALLFAILRLKPVPFCILDEIEAALDDANVIKFAEYISQFTDKTQFIIITHRKGTMEASDMLYGVTMQERGISKVVSLRMEKSA